MLPQRQEHTVHWTRSCGTAGADKIMVNYIFTDISLVEGNILQCEASKMLAERRIRYDLAT